MFLLSKFRFFSAHSLEVPHFFAAQEVIIGTKIIETMTAAAHCTVADSTYGTNAAEAAATAAGVATLLPAAEATAQPAYPGRFSMNLSVRQQIRPSTERLIH